MKCHRPEFLHPVSADKVHVREKRPAFPDRLVDYLTGEDIPFTNRDNIRQQILRFLIEEKGYHREEIVLDREIRFELEGEMVLSLVDISIRLADKTLMAWKCASGSLVSRERQIIASSRLLEDYAVPFAAVTNGNDLELLDTYSEKVIGSGFSSVFSRDELLGISKDIALRPVNKKKLIYEQRILNTYDSISCPASCKSDSGTPKKSS
jgi:hypothetical protein